MSHHSSHKKSRKSTNRYPKGLRLVAMIRNQFFRNPDPDMNIKHSSLEGDFKAMVIQNTSYTNAKILLQIDTILRNNGRTRMLIPAQYIANGVQLDERGRSLVGRKYKFGCSERTVRDYFSKYDGLFINTKESYTKDENGQSRQLANFISLTDLGKEVVEVYRSMGFASALFPQYKDGMSDGMWTTLVKNSRRWFREKKRWFAERFCDEGGWLGVLSYIQRWKDRKESKSKGNRKSIRARRRWVRNLEEKWLDDKVYRASLFGQSCEQSECHPETAKYLRSIEMGNSYEQTQNKIAPPPLHKIAPLIHPTKNNGVIGNSLLNLGKYVPLRV